MLFYGSLYMLLSLFIDMSRILRSPDGCKSAHILAADEQWRFREYLVHLLEWQVPCFVKRDPEQKGVGEIGDLRHKDEG
jgi:hypothetical protein